MMCLVKYKLLYSKVFLPFSFHFGGVINVSTTLFAFRANNFKRRGKEGGRSLSKLALEMLCITLYVLGLVNLKPSLQHEATKWL